MSIATIRTGAPGSCRADATSCYLARGVAPADGAIRVVDIGDGTQTEIMASGTQAESVPTISFLSASRR